VTARSRRNGPSVERETLQFDTEMAAPNRFKKDPNWHAEATPIRVLTSGEDDATAYPAISRPLRLRYRVKQGESEKDESGDERALPGRTNMRCLPSVGNKELWQQEEKPSWERK
jgi:hypothetical protein